ncbi:MAG: DUF3842 family protein [Nitrospirae bacterium]|nr:DUF3842 family protein [Nitrospirota bacterium]
MVIAVIDGQGGGIGAHVIEKLRKGLAETVEIVGLGTNAIATSLMMKAGANKGATGENAIVRCVASADLIVGSWAILMAHSMMGEITPGMAEAVAASPAPKFLLPLGLPRTEVVGIAPEQFPHLIEKLVDRIGRYNSN